MEENLRTAIYEALVGGNEIACIVIEHDLPPHTWDVDTALEHIGPGWKFRVWYCWRALMRLSEVVDESDYMKKEFSNLVRLDAKRERNGS